eukprot:1179928-Prorocentrum_minimum.AAC.2
MGKILQKLSGEPAHLSGHLKVYKLLGGGCSKLGGGCSKLGGGCSKLGGGCSKLGGGCSKLGGGFSGGGGGFAGGAGGRSGAECDPAGEPGARAEPRRGALRARLRRRGTTVIAVSGPVIAVSGPVYPRQSDS